MDFKLQEMLAHLTDEEFYELTLNIGLSNRIRELMVGENRFEMDEIVERLDITPREINYVQCGAYDFTTKMEASIIAMEEEKAFFDEQDVEDEIEEELEGQEEVNLADEINYNPEIIDKNVEEDDNFHSDVVRIGGNQKELSPQEEWELEHGYTPPIHTEKRPVYVSTVEKEFKSLMDQTYSDYQEKLKGDDSKKEDNSTVEFMDM